MSQQPVSLSSGEKYTKKIMLSGVKRQKQKQFVYSDMYDQKSMSVDIVEK